MKCSNCHTVSYCSKDCQRSDWAVHKIFCPLDTFPLMHEGELSATAILLPQSSITPVLIRLQYTIETHDGICFAKPALEEFIPGMCRGIQTDRLPGYPFAHLPHALIMKYKDDFNIDGTSLPNQCLMRLIKAKHPHWQKPFAWKGDLVIIKAEANVTDHQSFMDMTRGDAHDLVEFIVK